MKMPANPWLLGLHPLLTTKPAHHHSCSFVDQPLSLHILSYAQCNRAWFYLWQSFQTLKAAKKNTQSWNVKGFQDVEYWHHSYIWQISHDENANLEEPSNSTQNTWSQNGMKIYLEGKSLQEAVTCADVKSSTFRATLHMLLICCYWKRDVSF